MDEMSVRSCEQIYINRFKPEYNLNPLAVVIKVINIQQKVLKNYVKQL